MDFTTTKKAPALSGALRIEGMVILSEDQSSQDQ